MGLKQVPTCGHLPRRRNPLSDMPHVDGMWVKDTKEITEGLGVLQILDRQRQRHLRVAKGRDEPLDVRPNLRADVLRMQDPADANPEACLER